MKIQVVIGLLLAATAAHAGVHKCVDANGKITYTDRGCNGSQREGGLTGGNVSSFDGDEASSQNRAFLQTRDEQSAENAARRRGAEARAAVVAAQSPSYSERLRMRNLQLTEKSSVASKEQKQLAREEVDRIQRGVTADYSYDDRRRMDNAIVSSHSLLVDKREKGIVESHDIGNRHDTPAYLAARNAKEVAEREERRQQGAAAAAQVNAQTQAEKSH